MDASADVISTEVVDHRSTDEALLACCDYGYSAIVTEEFTDDLDGGRAEGPVRFAFNGTAYEIDLSQGNSSALEKVLSRTSTRPARPSPLRRRGSGRTATVAR
jgi:Lsr2